MRTWFNIANMLALVCLAIVMVVICKNIDIYEEQFNESRLIAATEYAAEAAFIDSVAISENLTTYESVGVTLLTKNTLQTFDDMMAISFDIARGEESEVVIEDSINAMCLVGNEGYYITDITETDSGEHRLIWSPKLPYSAELTRTNGTTKDTLGVTLSSEKWYLVTGPGNTLTSGYKYDEILKKNIFWINPGDIDGETLTLTRDFADSIVSSELTNAIAYRLSNNRFATRPDNSEYSLYIPAINTYTGINKINSPTLLVIVNNAKYSEYKGYCSTMQGFKVTWKPKVIGFTTDSGERKYCYEGQAAYVKDSVSNTTLYASIEAAARAGYKPDIYALMQPVNPGYTNR
mgnify:CR=1 FL=1